MPIAPDDREIAADLERDEARRQFPYMDCCGKSFRACACVPRWRGRLTVGVGRNLEDRGLSDAEIDTLLSSDIAVAKEDVTRGIPWALALSPVRLSVLHQMCFNLGWPKLRGFTRTLAAMRRGDYAAAAEGMRHSIWYRQVGARAERLAQLMERGA